MKLRLMLFLVLLALASLATAQDRPTVTAQPNTVYVSADGKFEANPDTAVVQFNISAQKNKSDEAYARASQAAEQDNFLVRGLSDERIEIWDHFVRRDQQRMKALPAVPNWLESMAP